MQQASAERVLTVQLAAYCSLRTGRQSGGAFYAQDSSGERGAAAVRDGLSLSVPEALIVHGLAVT